MKGRGPKPEALDALQGNPGKRRKDPGTTPAESTKVFFSEPPDPWSPPSALAPSAQAVWERDIEAARRQARMQQSQLPTFALYCDAIARFERYSAELEREGATYKTPSGYRRLAPEVGLRDRAAADIRQLAAELMLTPKSWASGMGTYAGRQLDLFRDRPGPSEGVTAPSPQKAPSDSVDS